MFPVGGYSASVQLKEEGWSQRISNFDCPPQAASRHLLARSSQFQQGAHLSSPSPEEEDSHLKSKVEMSSGRSIAVEVEAVARRPNYLNEVPYCLQQKLA